MEKKEKQGNVIKNLAAFTRKTWHVDDVWVSDDVRNKYLQAAPGSRSVSEEASASLSDEVTAVKIEAGSDEVKSRTGNLVDGSSGGFKD